MKNKIFKILICVAVAVSCFVILSAFASGDKPECPQAESCEMTECPTMGEGCPRMGEMNGCPQAGGCCNCK